MMFVLFDKPYLEGHNKQQRYRCDVTLSNIELFRTLTHNYNLKSSYIIGISFSVGVLSTILQVIMYMLPNRKIYNGMIIGRWL